MSEPRILLLSNTPSAAQLLKQFLATCGVVRLLLIPFAQPQVSEWENYVAKIKKKISSFSVHVDALSCNMTGEQMRQQLREANAIFIPGGNTFFLLSKLYKYDLFILN